MGRLLRRLLFSRRDAMLTEESVEVGAVDVDFAAYLREGDEALIAVVLPRLGGDAEDFADFVGLKPVFAGTSGLGFLDYLNETVEFLVQLLPLILWNHKHERCRGGV